MKTEHYGILFAILSPFFSSVATIFKTGAVKNLSPLIVIVIGAPVAYFLLGETLSLTQIFGAAIIIVTSFLIIREHLRETKSSSLV